MQSSSQIINTKLSTGRVTLRQRTLLIADSEVMNINEAATRLFTYTAGGSSQGLFIYLLNCGTDLWC